LGFLETNEFLQMLKATVYEVAGMISPPL